MYEMDSGTPLPVWRTKPLDIAAESSTCTVFARSDFSSGIAVGSQFYS
jgi:hypothetical protein